MSTKLPLLIIECVLDYYSTCSSLNDCQQSAEKNVNKNMLKFTGKIIHFQSFPNMIPLAQLPNEADIKK